MKKINVKFKQFFSSLVEHTAHLLCKSYVCALKLETTPRTHALELRYSSTHSLTLTLDWVMKALTRRKTSCRWRESNHSLFTIQTQWNKRIVTKTLCSVNSSSVLYRMWRSINKHARLTSLLLPHLRSQCSSPPADPSYTFLLAGVILTPSTSFLLWIALLCGLQWTSYNHTHSSIFVTGCDVNLGPF